MATAYVIPDAEERNRKSLARYVEAVRQLKRLTYDDIEQRSGRQISKSYVHALIKGAGSSMTIAKLDALARGLGVPPAELFAAARGELVTSPDEAIPVRPAIEEADLIRVLFKFSSLAAADRQDLARIVEILEDEVDRKAALAALPSPAE